MSMSILESDRSVRVLKKSALATFLATVPLPAFAAQEIAVETAYIMNSLSFLMHGFLVMFMAAGFAMLEAGLVRAKNTATQCLKNICLYAIAGLMFYIVGYNLMYLDVSGLMGSFDIWSAGDAPSAQDAEASGYSAGSDWFFQMVFVAATASIVSGAVAERAKLWPFFAFVVLLTGVIYPIQGAWTWGGGWLSEMGFSDFAGSTIVHSVGGWAALAGVIVIGARAGRYGADGAPKLMPGANLPLATLGTFILWLGWFGFNGGSQLAMGTIGDVTAIGTIYINTNAAALAGVLAATIGAKLIYGKPDLTMTLNGALAGLVSITAEPLAPTPLLAMGIGAIGGVLVVVTVPLMDRFKLDDVVGAIPVHLVCGIWGTLAVPLSNTDAQFSTQIIGILAIGAFAFTTSWIVWFALKKVVGVCASDEDQLHGLDRTEMHLDAYPEFAGRQ